MVPKPPLDFLLGAAVLVAPQHQVPLALGAAALKGLQALLRRRAAAKAGRQPGGEGSAAVGNGNGNGNGNGYEEMVLLEWSGVTCELRRKDGSTKQLLTNLNGAARPGRLLAIMGPSGSGKTTLLNTLAGQVPRSPALRLRGRVTANGLPLDQAHVAPGYVQQEDIFYSQLTVRETLLMTAHLRMPGNDASAKEAYVEALIRRLGLSKSADTIVGSAKTRGLSGGEKKRLAIGCELIAKPGLIFADEPTTGLDSFQAEQVMSTLKDLTGDGHTVVAAIHQPRSSVFAMFDDLVLLSEGRLLYAGPASEALAYFGKLGHACPEHFNPAEFLADLISIDHSSPEAEKETQQRLDRLAAAYQAFRQAEAAAASAGRPKALRPASPASAPRAPTPWHRQFRLLFQRSWRQVTRDKATNVARAASNISSALIFGSIFWRMGLGQTSIQNRMGLLQVAAINTAMASLTKTLGVFPTERVIVQRERAKASYAVAPYFGAKLAAELPIGALFPALFGAIVYPATGLHTRLSRFARFLGILTLESFASSALGLAVGATAPSPEAAMAIGPAVMVVFIVFGGYYVNAADVPLPLRWLPRTSLIKHGFEGVCLNEFRGLRFDPSRRPSSADAATGEQVLQRLGFADSSVAATLGRQARVLAFLYWFTYCILRARKPQFQPIEPPGAGAEGEEEQASRSAANNDSPVLV